MNLNWKEWPKSVWIFGISILIGLFLSFGELVNFLMNIIQSNFDSFFLKNAFDKFCIGFFYTMVPLTALFFLFDKNTQKIIKAGIIGSISFSILMILPRLLFFTPIPQLHKLFLAIFEPIFKGFFGTFIYIMYYALIGFLLGVLVYWAYEKIKSK